LIHDVRLDRQSNLCSIAQRLGKCAIRGKHARMKSSFLTRVVTSIALIASLAVAATDSASAQLGLNIHLGPQPPPRREYAGPPPHRGCFFVRGHYAARYNHWVWVRGHWRCH